jgi:hypothetical protein
MKHVHEVYINSDLTEGRGHDFVWLRLSRLEDAQAAAKGANTQGSDGYVKSHIVWDSVLEFKTHEAARESGLRKLNAAERKALGLE